MKDALMLNPDVVALNESDGSQRLINLGGRAAALNPQSAKLLFQLRKDGLDSTAKFVSNRLGIPLDWVKNDLEKFSDELMKNGFLNSVGGRPKLPLNKYLYWMAKSWLRVLNGREVSIPQAKLLLVSLQINDFHVWLA